MKFIKKLQEKRREERAWEEKYYSKSELKRIRATRFRGNLSIVIALLAIVVALT